ncbi:MAG: PEP-CTERM sorting domain-containing protein [Pirellulales bacterium]
MRYRFCAAAALLLVFTVFPTSVAHADLLVTNFFFGTVDRYDENTGALLQPGFMAPPIDDPLVPLGLADIVVNPANQQVFVSGRFSDRVYVFNGLTGEPIPGAQTPSGIDGVFLQLTSGQQPAGLEVDSSGKLYVANNGGTTIDIFDAVSGASMGTISDPSIALPSGLTFDAAGDLFITTLGGAGTLRWDGTDVTSFAAPTVVGPFAPNSVLVDAAGQVYVADVFGDGIYKYMADGTEIPGASGPFINIDPFMPDPSVTPSFDVNAPSGLLFDQDGNILVAVLGATNPGEGDLNGALLRFAPDGTFIEALGTKLPPLSSLVSAPVPEPSSVALLMTGGAVGLFALLRKRRRKARSI